MIVHFSLREIAMDLDPAKGKFVGFGIAIGAKYEFEDIKDMTLGCIQTAVHHGKQPQEDLDGNQWNEAMEKYLVERGCDPMSCIIVGWTCFQCNPQHPKLQWVYGGSSTGYTYMNNVNGQYMPVSPQNLPKVNVAAVIDHFQSHHKEIMREMPMYVSKCTVSLL